jgi:hypothetical protein
LRRRSVALAGACFERLSFYQEDDTVMAKTSHETREIAHEIDIQTECIVAAILAVATTTGKVRVAQPEVFRAYKEMLHYLREHGGAVNPAPE